MANTTCPVATYFLEPTNIQQARRQANILERASNLFTTGGYRLQEDPTGGGFIYNVTAPDGHGYSVDTIFDHCTCASHAEDRDCKHRIAVALELAREAAQVAELEEENRWWMEAGFSERPLYIP